MSIKHLFIREHDGSACGKGYCAHDEKCTKACEGHPRNYGVEAADTQAAGYWPITSNGGASVDTGEIEMYETAWDVIARLAQRTAGWAVLVCFAGGLVWLIV